MSNARYWLALSLVVAVLATAAAQTSHVSGTMTHDSDETNDSKLRKNEFSDFQIRDGKRIDDQTNSRTGRQLSVIGQSPYDHHLGISRFGSTNLLGATNQYGSSSLFGSGGLNGFNTPGYLDSYGNYQTLNPFGNIDLGSRLYPYTGSYSAYGLSNNPYYNSAQLLGGQLGTNYLPSGSFGSGLLSNGLLSSQLGNGLFSTNHQLSNHLLSKSHLYNSLRNQYGATQRFGNQLLTPEGVARTIVHDAHNDGYGQYSYQ